MAHTLDNQIAKLQNSAWTLAEECRTELMKVKDQIFERGLIMAETECLKALNKEASDETKRDYLEVLHEAHRFYKRIAKAQQV